jgi:hypothetical protein
MEDGRWGAAEVVADDDGFGEDTTFEGSTGRDAAGVAEQDGAGRAGDPMAHKRWPLINRIVYPALQVPSASTEVVSQHMPSCRIAVLLVQGL